MADVDPFVVPIPKAFGKTNTPEEVEVHEYFLYLHRHLHDMWQRSGGGNDNLEDVVDVIGGEEGAELPEGNEPVWEDEDWVFWAGN